MEFNLIIKDDARIKQYECWEENEEIQIFREYLRIPSVHPNIDYRKSPINLFDRSYIKHSESDGCCYIKSIYNSIVFAKKLNFRL